MANFNAGTAINIEASAHKASDSFIVLRGWTDTSYPILGVHMSPDEAAELARQIGVALESLAQPEEA